MAESGQQFRVIVADDDPIVRGVLLSNLGLRSELDSVDMRVFEAENGHCALTLATSMRVDLVILDIRMPVLDGLAACARIRALPQYETTPIVILTLDDRAPTELAARRAGATMFLVKPFGSRTLMRALSRLLPMTNNSCRRVGWD